jgi:ADP-ribose pyrophosphatase YjhB (NUDIX family)
MDIDQGPPLRFCPVCGGRLAEKQLDTEDRPRLVCDDCGYILYRNPKLVVGALPLKDGRVILLRRGLEPRRGAWTFPSGYVELGESLEEAAVRETKEETNLEVEITSLLNIYSRTQVGVVVVIYLARIVGGQPRPGPEALEIAAFGPSEIPWAELAFPSTEWALSEWARGATSTSPLSRAPRPN